MNLMNLEVCGKKVGDYLSFCKLCGMTTYIRDMVNDLCRACDDDIKNKEDLI